MTIATGVARAIAYKAESTWGTLAGASGSTFLRRITCDLDQSRSSYMSNEIRTDYQIADLRLGPKKASGSLKGELSPGSYSEFLAAALRRTFTAVTALSALTITIAGAGPTYTLTRSTGSYLTDGLKIGNVVRLTAGSFNAANLNNNLLVVTLTATVATVYVLNGSALVAEGPIATATMSIPGKKTYVPTSGHTNPSYTFEGRFGDIAQYEAYTGIQVSTAAISAPGTGMIGIDIGLMGQQRAQAGGTPYFTTPGAAASSGVLASNSGILVVNGVANTIVTGLNLSYDGGMTSPDGVVGSNLIPAIFPGRAKITGDLSAYFADGTLRDAFDAETVMSLLACFSTGTTAAADFVAISLPLVKFMGATKDDGEKGLTQKIPFQAVFNSAGGAGTSSEQSTIAIQDSLAA